MTASFSGGEGRPESAKCLWSDIASNPGETQVHDGGCQQCGTDGQWFDVQGVKCSPYAPANSEKLDRTSVIKVTTTRRVSDDKNFCFDSRDRAYSIGALRFTTHCLRCDTHATFSQDNEENCRVCQR